MKTLKSIFFIPISLLALAVTDFFFIRLLNWTIAETIVWHARVDIVYFVLLMPIFWMIIWGIFKLSSMALAAALIPLAPDKKFPLYSLGSLALLNGVGMIMYQWAHIGNISGRAVILLLCITAFILDFSTTIMLVFSRKGSHAFDEN